LSVHQIVNGCQLLKTFFLPYSTFKKKTLSASPKNYSRVFHSKTLTIDRCKNNKKSTGFPFPLEFGGREETKAGGENPRVQFKRILKKDLLLVRNLSEKYLMEKLLSNKQKRLFLGIIVQNLRRGLNGY